MPREYKLYLRDIRTAIERIERYVEGFDLERFRDDDLVVDGALRNFTVIGEAAKNVPDDIRAKYSDVPWRALGSFRDLLTHEYFRVDLEQTWSIINERLPELKAQIIAILEQEDDSHAT
jgi:uncharacterized protein with HEPN domain